MSTRTRDALLVALGLTVATSIYFHQLLGSITHAIPLELRDPLLNTWILAWDADRFRHGFGGLWQMPILYPFHDTLAFSEHLFGIALFAAPLEWVTGNPVLAYNVVFVASFVFAGIAMFVLARDVTGRTDAAIVAAAIYAFYPARIAQAGHLQLLVNGWMPLSLLALRRYFATVSPRWLAAAVAAILLQALSNGYYLFYFAAALAIVIPWNLWRMSPALRPRAASQLAVAGLLAAAVYAPIAMMYIHVRSEYGLVRSESDVEGFSADVGSYLTMPPAVRAHLPVPLPSYPKPSGPEEAHDGMLFPGFTMLVLAAFGLFVGPGETVIVYALIACVAFVFSLGPQPTAWGHPMVHAGPYAWFLHTIPALYGLRVPARFAHVVYLGLTLVAACGAATLLSGAGRRTAVLVTAALVGIVLFEGYGAVPLAEVGPHGHATEARAMYEWLAHEPDGAVLELPAGRLDRHYRGFVYEYQTLVHHHPIVNGWTGYTTDLQQMLGAAGSPLLVPDVRGGLQMLRGMGVRYVLLHPDDFDDVAEASAMRERLDAAHEEWTTRAEFGDSTAYVLPERPAARSDAEAKTLVAVPPGRITLVTPFGADMVRYLTDGDLDSRWSTQTPQRGNEWIELAFGTPLDVRRLRIAGSTRYIEDYPRGLEIDAVTDTGVTPLFTGSAQMEFGRALQRDPIHPVMEFWLPHNMAQRIRVRQTGDSQGIWFWSVTEVMVDSTAWPPRPHGSE